MTGIDEHIIRWLNSYANCVPEFDSLMLLVRMTNLLKGG